MKVYKPSLVHHSWRCIRGQGLPGTNGFGPLCPWQALELPTDASVLNLSKVAVSCRLTSCFNSRQRAHFYKLITQQHLGILRDSTLCACCFTVSIRPIKVRTPATLVAASKRKSPVKPHKIQNSHAVLVVWPLSCLNPHVLQGDDILFLPVFFCALIQTWTSSIHSLNPMPNLPLNIGHLLLRGTKTCLSTEWEMQ